MGTLAAPSYATPVDIFFSNNPVDVVTIGDVSSYLPQYPGADYTFHIVWDELNTVDQQRLLDLVDAYGGDVPFAAPVAGTQVVNVSGTATAGGDTGLDTTPVQLPTLVFRFKEPKLGTDPTGLNEFNDDGIPEITRIVTRDADSAPDTLGGKHFTLSSATTDYYVWYNTGSDTDPAPGGTGVEVSIASDEFAVDVAKKTAAALRSLPGTPFVVFVTGTTLTIETTDLEDVTDSTNGDTSFDITKVQDGDGPTPRTYGFILYNGTVVEPVMVAGTLATIDDLLTALNTQLTSVTVTLNGDGNILFTSTNVAEFSPTSTLAIRDLGLFANLEDGLYLEPPVVSPGTFYETHIEVDGVVEKLVIPGQDAPTFNGLITALSAASSNFTTAIDANGNLVLTSATTGNGSNIKILPVLEEPTEGTVPLWQSITGFAGFETPLNGADDFVDALFVNRGPGGQLFYTFAKRAIGDKPPVGGPSNDVTAVYYDGTDWVRLIDDTPV